MILDPMILDPVIFDLVILDSVIFDLVILDSVILDSVILDSVILDPAFPWSQIPPAVYLSTAVLIVLVVLCYSSNKRGPEQAQP